MVEPLGEPSNFKQAAADLILLLIISVNDLLMGIIQGNFIC